MEYTFTLIYVLDPEDADHDAIVERFGAAGYTECLLGIGRSNILAVELVCEAADAEAAVEKAVHDIAALLPTAKLVETTPVLCAFKPAA